MPKTYEPRLACQLGKTLKGLGDLPNKCLATY
jgi:hypothetical protein